MFKSSQGGERKNKKRDSDVKRSRDLFWWHILSHLEPQLRQTDAVRGDDDPTVVVRCVLQDGGLVPGPWSRWVFVIHVFIFHVTADARAC